MRVSEPAQYYAGVVENNPSTLTASLDKTSVKDEFGRLNADFDRFGSEGKVSSEIQAII